MKKYLLCVIGLIILTFFSFLNYFVFDFYIKTNKKIYAFTKTDSNTIYLNDIPYVIKGVNIGAGIPGHFATDYAIDKKQYKRWFKQIQDMGANTIRVYTILSPDFYNAFYEYNEKNDNPLYLLHGVWVNDYIQNSKRDAYSKDFGEKLLSDTKVMIDVIHGRKYIPPNSSYANGLYTKNISKWTIGYILGVEWEDVTVAYTNHKNTVPAYKGEYISAKDNATAFSSLLAYIGDNSVKYESEKYGEQRLLAFSNWPTTDPITYSEKVSTYFKKSAKVDVEELEFSEKFIGGTFASYHIYPYYPDYLNYEENKEQYVDSTGNINTYYAYLKKLSEHHNIPVIISEFGVPTSRAVASLDRNKGFDQGNMTEEEQGLALISMYKSILEANCNGGIVFTWQDEWFKRTWNTMANVDLNHTAYWSDAQTNEQYFGLLSFDPGKTKSIVYIDGDISEWTENDVISEQDDNTISMKYDEKYIYLLANIKDYNKEQKIYIPIDTTQKSGTTKTNISSNTYNRDIDFLIEISGENNSRVYVHEYYDALLAIHAQRIIGKDIYINKPDKKSTSFNKINLILQTATALLENVQDGTSEIAETGKLEYGNANPNSQNYNSLADYIINGEYIEIRIPWQLLNFSNPSKMMIHDDYFEHYGIEEQKIEKMYIGLGTESTEKIILHKAMLKGWNNKVTYHERLKKSYYILQKYWKSGEQS